jgi:hypothetical protein
MSPARTPLDLLNGNENRGKDFSPFVRGQIIGARRAGMRKCSIEREFGYSRGGISTILANQAVQPEGKSKPRPGTPRIYTDRDRRIMLKNLRLHPKFTFDQRRAETGLKCKNTWIKDLARANGLHH